MDERRLRVVICDDDRTVRHVVGSMAEECGFDVVGEAALALEALVPVEMTSAHVLVLDLSLTGMSGTEIIASVKAAALDTMAALVHHKDVFAVVRKDQPGKLEDALHRAATERRRFVTRF